MSYTFPGSALHPRRWLHLPSLAILALAGTAAFATDRIVDAWSATQPRAREAALVQQSRQIRVRGAASRPGIAPTRVTWSVTLNAHARAEADVRRQLAAQRAQALAALADAGVPDADLRVRESTVDVDTRTITKTAADGSVSEESVPDGYLAVQTLEITSSDIASSLASYGAVSRNTALVVASLGEPQCTLVPDPQLEAALVREAQADVRHNAEALVRTLGHSQLGELVGVEVGRMTMDTSSITCTPTTASVGIDAVYQLR